MADEYCRALGELADGIPLAVSLWEQGNDRRLGVLVNQSTAHALALSEHLLRAFCPSLPRNETILLAEALHECMLAVRCAALTVPSHHVQPTLTTAIYRLASHLSGEIALLPRLLHAKRDALPQPRARATVREEAYTLRTRLLLHTAKGMSEPYGLLPVDTLIRALTDAESRYLLLALECS